MANNDLLGRIAERFNQIACPKCSTAIDVSAMELFTTIKCPACDTPQVVPARISNFLLVGRLGTGGMASVFEAYDRALGRRVAIKFLLTEFGDDPKFIDGFLREARAAAQLNHPNVVQIYQVGQEKGVPFLVMELLKGGRLDDATNAGRKLGELQVLDIALDVAKGLKAADAIRLVHGDIKPANILFDQKGIAKVADFGLAKFQGKQAPGKGEVWGTPFYIAPEKVRKQPEDARSDIYSLGATLYHALAGRPPFDGKDAKDVVVARLQDLPEPLTGFRHDLCPQTVMLISRMLEPDPERRHPNYSSLISDIQAAIQAAKNRPSGTVPSAAPGTGGGNRALYIGGGLVATAVIIGLILAGGGKDKKSPPTDGARPASPPATPARPATPAATPKPVPGASAVSVQPFQGADERAIVQGFALMAQGKNRDAVSNWTEWAKSAPADHPGQAWMLVLQALPSFLERDNSAVDSKTKTLREKTFPPRPDGSPDPAVLPQAVARYLVSKQWIDPPVNPKGAWPAWFANVSSALQALGLLNQKKMTDGRAALAAASKLDWSGGPAWTAGFGSVVDYYLKSFNSWDRHNKEGGALLKDQKYREALEALVKDRASQPRALYLNYRKMVAQACTELMKKPGPPVRKISADCEETGDEAANAIDGNPMTKWHTTWQKKEIPYPHHLVLEFEKPIVPFAFCYLARQDPPTTHGMVRSCAIYLSADGSQWGEPVAKGTFDDQREWDAVVIPRPAQPVRFVQFAATGSIDGKKFASAAEVRVLTE